MFARIFTRAPIATRAFARNNSSSSTSGAARVIQMAAQAERPGAFTPHLLGSDAILRAKADSLCLGAAEAAVPVMWAVCGALTYTAWNRMDSNNASGNVEKLLIV
jgi:hypothetical protein